MTAVQHARERSFCASVLILGLLFGACAGGSGGTSREPIAPAAARGEVAHDAGGAEEMSRSKPPEDIEPVAAGTGETPALPEGFPASARAELTPEQRAAFANAPTVYVDWHGTAKLEGLEIHVDSLEEKRDVDGHELMIVELTVRAGALVQKMRFSGEKSRPLVFAGHLVQCRGGSRKAIGLAVIRADAQ